MKRQRLWPSMSFSIWTAMVYRTNISLSLLFGQHFETTGYKILAHSVGSLEGWTCFSVPNIRITMSHKLKNKTLLIIFGRPTTSQKSKINKSMWLYWKKTEYFVWITRTSTWVWCVVFDSASSQVIRERHLYLLGHSGYSNIRRHSNPQSNSSTL